MADAAADREAQRDDAIHGGESDAVQPVVENPAPIPNVEPEEGPSAAPAPDAGPESSSAVLTSAFTHLAAVLPSLGSSAPTPCDRDP